MDSKVSSRSSSPEPVAKPEKKKRVMGEKQKAALQLGMAKLKEKREAMAREKEERKKTNEELKAKGLPPVEPPIKLKKAEVKDLPKLEPVAVTVKERKVRKDKGEKRKDPDPMRAPINKEEFAELRGLVATLRQSVPKEVEKQVIKEVDRPVDRIVEREKVLSGSDLLNKIFFSK